MADKNSTLTPFQKQQAEAAKQILEYKLGAEASIVSMIYRNPDLLRETNLTIKDFHHNCWKVYFEIAKDLIINERKITLSEVDIGLFTIILYGKANYWICFLCNMPKRFESIIIIHFTTTTRY